ncbi:hypothetical protein NX059_010949 [Plenodomus lindquistii]|nr:hypothetical protein NX059_010949 [Plenodomus lindquistii]
MPTPLPAVVYTYDAGSLGSLEAAAGCPRRATPFAATARHSLPRNLVSSYQGDLGIAFTHLRGSAHRLSAALRK